MSWNYRVISFQDENSEDRFVGIHEVFYNEDETIKAVSEEPRPVCGNNIDELRDILQKMMECLKKEILVDGKIEFKS